MLGRMAVNISIDLSEATYADLVALVEAARVAGVEPDSKLELEETTLRIAADPTAIAPVRYRAGSAGSGGTAETDKPARDSHFAPLGDAAIRSVVDILTGRQEPPRR